MRADVIDHRGRGYSAVLIAHDAEGMAHQVGLAGLVPPGGVTSLSGTASVLTRTGEEVDGLWHSLRHNPVAWHCRPAT
jgi:hypothetical protein